MKASQCCAESLALFGNFSYRTHLRLRENFQNITHTKVVIFPIQNPTFVLFTFYMYKLHTRLCSLLLCISDSLKRSFCFQWPNYPQLIRCPVPCCPNVMVVPSSRELFKMLVDSCFKHIMQAKHVNIVCNIQIAWIFQIIKNRVINI